MGNVSTTIRVVDRASAKLNKIYDAINRVDNAFLRLGVNKSLNQISTDISDLGIRASKSFDDMEKAVGDFVSKLNAMPSQVTIGLNKVENEVKDIGEAANKSGRQTNLLISKLRRLASTYLGVMGAQAMITASDTLTSANNKFVTYGTQNFGMDVASAEAFSADTLEKIYNSAFGTLFYVSL